MEHSVCAEPSPKQQVAGSSPARGTRTRRPEASLAVGLVSRYRRGHSTVPSAGGAPLSSDDFGSSVERDGGGHPLWQGQGAVLRVQIVCELACGLGGLGSRRCRSGTWRSGHFGSWTRRADGNDVSSRSIEGENPLYLPRPKLYRGRCALGRCLVGEAPPPAEMRITMTIERDGAELFRDGCAVADMRRSLPCWAAPRSCRRRS
jgi:hypothetical protein